MEFLKFTKSRTVNLIISITVFLVFAFLVKFTILLENMENGSTNLRFYLRAPDERQELESGLSVRRVNPRIRNDIIIVGIDENTLRDFDSKGIQWPFDWKIHAKVTDYLSTGNPLAIFFDIVFLEHKSGEKELAESFRKSDRVFVDYQFTVSRNDAKYSDSDERLEILNRSRFAIDPDDNQRPWVKDIVPPTSLIADSVKGMGYANIQPDSDHINRKLPVIIKHDNHYYASIDLSLTMRYFGITKDDVEVKMGQYVRLNNLPVEKMAKPNESRSIDIPIDDNGFMNINFVGGSGSFTNIPYYMFYKDGAINNKSLENKFVFIAAYSVSGIARDVHKSPYGETFGIEHHANAMNTILNQDFLYKFSDNQNLLIMFIVALLLGFFLPRFNPVWSTVSTVLFALAYSSVAYIMFDWENTIIGMASPLMESVAIFSLVLSYNLVTEQREKRYIRQTFSKFVSKSVVDDLLKHPEKLKLGGDRKILTVLFSDIRGFTSISERLTPEQLVEHLNEYLQSMTDIVIKYDGTLDKYVGDEIMAFWGAPIPQDDHALRACKGALEMMSVLDRLNEHWESIGKPTLDIGIGLNTGDMVVGNMGSASRMDYTLMGDMVNLGARLEGTNKVYGTHVIISEFTYEHVKDKVYVRELDLIRVKGKEKPVMIYELIDVLD